MAKGDRLYAWQTLENGDWGLIATLLDHAGQKLVMPLVGRSEEVARGIQRDSAILHNETYNLPVRLVSFEMDTVEEYVDAPA
jgi:hypothetical protein